MQNQDSGMSRSYYVIELSARWLTVLLIALALIMGIAFALGYGAAWSVLTAEQTEGEMTALQAFGPSQFASRSLSK